MEAISKQLVLSTQSGRLKPDVRLGVAISEFAQVLDDDRKREFHKMQTAGTQLCGRDAIRVTEELNRKSERSHHAWRPYGTKCGKFLDRLQTLANIGDVMIGGSQNVIATSIWCAVRLSLQTATNFRGYFERLSSLFLKLGTSWELHHEFSQIFPQSSALQTFLCEYLIVLMRLCRKAVVFSNKSLAGQLWSSLGASFESEFRPLQEEMDKWGLLIQHKTQQLATTHVVDAEMFRRRDYKQRILHLLSPNQPQYVTTWRRHRRKGKCKWIYQTTSFNSWIAEDASSTLCISGKLGSGKTVTMANLVAQMNMQQTCAFYFCTFKEQESLKARTVLGSIAFHLLDSIPGDDSTWDVLSKQEGTTSQVLTSTGIIRLLTDLLPEHTKYVVVLDGLEDCSNDEITEVVDGLCRLMARHKVLLCYSTRSGSTFQRLTTQSLAVNYTLSLDEKIHDDEIKAYITEEVARRTQMSQPGLFNDKLIELVEKQLLAGSQGMYLWVSLQLDSIFPSQPTIVVTYEQILNLINNLPKDLPEAFERALEAIIDDRYGDSIMKIVMAARSPLTLDELKVALTVVPGDPVWYAAKVPTNSSQLISLCGGNLLELDEEDGKVRFIHHSVVSHLLQATKNLRTMLYHFTLQEAEIQSAAICVTFLNMPIFETAITVTRKLDGTRLAGEVIGAATHEQPRLAHLVHLFKKTERRQHESTGFDIGRMIAEIQATRLFKSDPHCFQDYAVSNWLPHSRTFHRENPLCEQIWGLWMRLWCSNIQVARPPFQSPVEDSWPALSWALENHHKALIYAIFEEPTTEPTDGERLSKRIIELKSPDHSKRFDSCSLGLILTHLLQLAINTMVPGPRAGGDEGFVGSEEPRKLLCQSIQRLLDLGADPTMMKHSKNGYDIVRMLLAAFGCISETTVNGRRLYDLLTSALAYDNVQPSLRSSWVPDALRRILELDNTQVFETLLQYVPKVHLEANIVHLFGTAIAGGNIGAVRALVRAWPEGDENPGFVPDDYGKPAIQFALQVHNRKKEIVALLAERSARFPPHLSARLLEIALERMDVEWVEFLLQLGADPNLGYQANVEEPVPQMEFRYHLQIAAERNQTLKFLTLIRYGADPSLPVFPTISNIIHRRDNRVLVARLKELDFFEPNRLSKSLGLRPQDGLPPSSALLEASKMLALNENEDQTLRHFGLVLSQDVGIQIHKRELKLILLDLAKTTHPDRLNVGCLEGNTALHYLTGGMSNFNSEALYVASHLLDSEPLLLSQRNKYNQTPLHRAIENGSRNNWSLPNIDSALLLLSRLLTVDFSEGWGPDSDESILGFAISKGAPVDPLVRAILNSGYDLHVTLQGDTPLEIAVNMPDFHYASMVTDCLLSYGACPNRSKRNVHVVSIERKDLLERMLIDRARSSWRSRDSSPATSDTSTRAVREELFGSIVLVERGRGP